MVSPLELSPFLERLSDGELLTLCQTSHGFRSVCINFLPGRAQKRYNINLNPSNIFLEFRVLADYEAGRINNSDALLRSVILGNPSMQSYFRRLLETQKFPRRDGSTIACLIVAIGSSMIHDINYSEWGCLPPKTNSLIEEIFVAVISLEDYDVSLIDSKTSDVIKLIVETQSIDLMRYFIKDMNGIFVNPGKAIKILFREAIYSQSLGVLPNTNFLFRVINLARDLNYDISNYIDIVRYLIRNKANPEILDAFVTPGNFDYLYKILSRPWRSRGGEDPRAAEDRSYADELLRRYPQYLGKGERLRF